MATDIDARGLLCPLPVLRLRKTLLSVAPGDVVRMIATDAMAQIDVPHFCAEQGHEVQAITDLGNGVTEFRVARGFNPTGDPC
ncbi:sulfurtransferase TusA family protein [Paracoccus sp. (in: a-proteobacteria)]|uniref:sulfurtransferase TusA family protein n=1 Tax=Paracoccus sp. TaxID=267 RepID=UPI0026DEDE2A|nr:sulfurtransferase TusA family protein [Paracoccus sp. (in: a-proteobacteria)]MDO5647608.1 sulfurtransferase TusA family protein [Paracoccus sp. (in: a-proteobacteria)]